MAKLSKIDGNYVLNDYRLKATDEMFLDCGESIEVNVQVADKRFISEQQRKFIFALCNEIEYYTGNDSEFMRLVMEKYNADLRGIEIESLSNCSVTYANGLISTIINFCIDKEIPFTRKSIDDYGYSFNEKQTYAMALKRICVICGHRADIHHVDHIGMGNDRKTVSHVGKRSLPLCREHHGECHTVGEERFITKYHLTPFIIDKKMEYFIKKGQLKTHD